MICFEEEQLGLVREGGEEGRRKGRSGGRGGGEGGEGGEGRGRVGGEQSHDPNKSTTSAGIHVYVGKWVWPEPDHAYS